MLYDVALRIRYDYEQSTDAGLQLLRLLPLDRAGEQRLIAGRIDVSPRPATRRDRADFFGNPVTEVRFAPAQSFVEYRVTARVERHARVEALDLSPPVDRLAAEAAGVRSLAADAPHHYIAASPRLRPRRVLTAFAAEHADGAPTTLEAVRRVGRALHGHMSFDAGATDVDTPPEKAFEARRGVCQDYTHIMIAGLRGLGVPAAYVSGYLRTDPPEGQARLEGADAMHAWLRAWCGLETGWVDYDPTNDVLVGRDHVTVAAGRDYSDAVPVQGVLRTAGSQRSLQEVTIRPLGPDGGG